MSIGIIFGSLSRVFAQAAAAAQSARLQKNLEPGEERIPAQDHHPLAGADARLIGAVLRFGQRHDERPEPLQLLVPLQARITTVGKRSQTPSAHTKRPPVCERR